jgi:hypothetical protein
MIFNHVAPSVERLAVYAKHLLPPKATPHTVSCAMSSSTPLLILRYLAGVRKIARKYMLEWNRAVFQHLVECRLNAIDSKVAPAEDSKRIALGVKSGSCPLTSPPPLL